MSNSIGATSLLSIVFQPVGFGDGKKSLGGLKIETYYEIKRMFDEPNPNYPKTETEFHSLENDKGLKYYVDGFRNLLEKSIDDELISDVPLATILSGGIDSSIITYLLSKRIPNIER